MVSYSDLKIGTPIDAIAQAGTNHLNQFFQILRYLHYLRGDCETKASITIK